MPNDALSDSPRPQSREEAFDGIAGQDSLLDRLVDTERGARARGRPFPHTLLVGPPGTGKTTLSRGIAALIGARFHTTCGPLLAQPGALDALLDGVGQGDVVFVDEVHAVPRPVLEVLYESMDAGRFTLLAATTEEGDLPDPLHSRFGLVEALTFFAVEDLASIVQACAEREGFVVASEAALRIAGAARGTPREALRLAERAMDEAAAAGRRTLGALQVEATLTRLGFDRDGLNPTERRYLRLLRSCRGPTPLARIARMLGLNCRTLLRHVEPFLFTRGLVRVTPRGRVAV
ncbi:MAG: AAA family ATPase [Planctomycetota bacterium]|nr:AAA family ATPase [Planctomycetota bacterium]